LLREKHPRLHAVVRVADRLERATAPVRNNRNSTRLRFDRRDAEIFVGGE
jgi:hypothetical protein